jgi:hypothetical protein
MVCLFLLFVLSLRRCCASLFFFSVVIILKWNQQQQQEHLGIRLARFSFLCGCYASVLRLTSMYSCFGTHTLTLDLSFASIQCVVSIMIEGEKRIKTNVTPPPLPPSLSLLHPL